MKKNAHLFLFLIFIACSSCSNPLKNAVTGSWTAALITEEGEELAVNTGEVKLKLKENGQYNYSSTLNYKEAGFWFLDENLLFTDDTIHKAGQKAVMVLEAKQDTLVLKMMENGKGRLLILKKE